LKDIIKVSEEINDQVAMSIRRFLKQVGITSQEVIEDTLSTSTDNSVKLNMTLTCEDSEGRVVTHTLAGEIGSHD
tara:strand:+ start:48 stop:272 length:225 start_codon:yes stop_codon:yes gene_type:complete